MNAPAEQGFAWKSVILSTLGIGTGVGLLIAALEVLFGVSVHPGIGGILAGIAIGLLVSRLNRPRDS